MGSSQKRSFSSNFRTSYVSTVISISLVLFLLGVMSLLLFNLRALSDNVKENLGFSVILKDSIKTPDVQWVKKRLDASKFVKSTDFVSKQQAAEQLEADMGEDFTGFLGYNPLPSSIDVKLKAEYFNPDSITNIKNQILRYNQVKEIFYHESLLDSVVSNIAKISSILLLFSILLFTITYALIRNTVRLAIYSKRFSINTMQLVGATDSFIRSPFLRKAVIQGLTAAAITMLMIFGSVIYDYTQFGGVLKFEGLILVGIIIIAAGVLITFSTTWFGVNRYLKMSSDELYR